MNWVLWLRAHLGKGNLGRDQAREGGSEMKGRGLVLQEPTRTWAAFSLPTAGHRDRA